MKGRAATQTHCTFRCWCMFGIEKAYSRNPGLCLCSTWGPNWIWAWIPANSQALSKETGWEPFNMSSLAWRKTRWEEKVASKKSHRREGKAQTTKASELAEIHPMDSQQPHLIVTLGRSEASVNYWKPKRDLQLAQLLSSQSWRGTIRLECIQPFRGMKRGEVFVVIFQMVASVCRFSPGGSQLCLHLFLPSPPKLALIHCCKFNGSKKPSGPIDKEDRFHQRFHH